jgi:hypothetical protein
MAADSGVRLEIIMVRSSFAIRYFPPSAVDEALSATLQGALFQVPESDAAKAAPVSMWPPGVQIRCAQTSIFAMIPT